MQLPLINMIDLMDKLQRFDINIIRQKLEDEG